MENDAFYVVRLEILERYRCRLGGKTGIHEMDKSTAVEIDEAKDWERVERLLSRRRQKCPPSRPRRPFEERRSASLKYRQQCVTFSPDLGAPQDG
jgi:hypothetical protein